MCVNENSHLFNKQRRNRKYQARVRVAWSFSQAMRAWRSASCGTRILRPSSKRALSYSRARQYESTSSRQKTQSIAELLESGAAAEDVQVDGWVRSVRKQKRIAFAAVGDGSTVDSVQAVLKPEDAAGYGRRCLFASQHMLMLR